MSDPSVLLTTDGPSLQFENEKQRAQFELGVACAVFLWDDLATAVANGWGGPESDAKREWLAGAVTDLFDAAEVATEDIEYRLLAAMEDEFDVTIEDETALQVAHNVVKVYQQCADQNYTFAQELFQKYQQRTPAQPVRIEEDEDSEGEPELVAEPMDVDPPTEPKQPEVDDDGFTIVRRK